MCPGARSTCLQDGGSILRNEDNKQHTAWLSRLGCRLRTCQPNTAPQRARSLRRPPRNDAHGHSFTFYSLARVVCQPLEFVKRAKAAALLEHLTLRERGYRNYRKTKMGRMGLVRGPLKRVSPPLRTPHYFKPNLHFTRELAQVLEETFTRGFIA